MPFSIGIRELRQHASRYLRLVEERGEPIQITDRGRPVALLTPMPATQSRVEQLRARGRIRRGQGSWRDLGPPLEPTPGVPLPSQVLAEMREHER
jgi:prevent-host-death family protein